MTHYDPFLTSSGVPKVVKIGKNPENRDFRHFRQKVIKMTFRQKTVQVA